MNTPGLTKTPEEFGREKTAVARVPASVYVTLNSADRFVNAQPAQDVPATAPWNDFRLQKPQALLDAFARRIQVTEVRFPWYIPNITSKNNYAAIILTTPAPAVLQIGIPSGFYTPSTLVSALQGAIDGAVLAAALPANYAPVVTITNGITTLQKQAGGVNFVIVQPASAPTIGNPNPTLVTPYQYQTGPSLFRTLGFDVRTLAYSYTPLSPAYKTLINSNPTTLLYTDYVDIVSEKLNYRADVRDGGSGLLTQPALVCRLYAADEVSLTSTNPIGTAPFVIHRQFKTPKAFQWDPSAFLDWMDLQVYDQYGELVPLPLAGTGAYPDFQITLLASES